MLWARFFIKSSDSDFTVNEKIEHRIMSTKYGYLDIVPFGEINEHDSNLKWPPDYDIELNLIGFEDTFKHAIDITIRDITIKVASPLGFALLKLFAWVDRRAQKDASTSSYK